MTVNACVQVGSLVIKGNSKVWDIQPDKKQNRKCTEHDDFDILC